MITAGLFICNSQDSICNLLSLSTVILHKDEIIPETNRKNTDYALAEAPGTQRKTGSITSLHRVKHEIALRALRLCESKGVTLLVQVYTIDGRSDNVGAIRPVMCGGPGLSCQAASDMTYF